MPWFRLLGWRRSRWITLTLGTACGLASGLLTLWVAPQVGQAISAWPLLPWKALTAISALLSARAVCAFCAVYLLGAEAARVVSELRRELFARFVRATLAFHDRSSSADLVSTLAADTGLIQEAIAVIVPAAIQSLPLGLAATILLFITDWRLAGSLALLGLLLLLFPLAAGRALRRLATQGQDRLAQLGQIAQETLLGIRPVKAMAREAYFIERFRQATENHFAVKRQAVIFRSAIEGFFPVAAAIFLAVLVLIYWTAVSEHTAPAQLGRFVTYLVILGTTVLGLVRTYASLEVVRGAARRIARLYGAVEGSEEAGPDAPVSGPGDLVLHGITFRYPGRGSGLHDVSVHIAPGEIVSVVGQNGAGKSTLVHLLLRFYEPETGNIRLDGCLPAQFGLANWRRHFAVVSRDPAIFSMTLGENIALARPGISQAEVKAAAQAVGLHEFITSLPAGYSTQTGENGVRLSAGQRQRLALARVFLQNPAIIILDEAMTSIDTASQDGLREALKLWAGQRTMILISHEPATLWPVTRVIRLKAGRIVFDSANQANGHSVSA